MLISALDEEVALLDRLRGIFASQREALAAGDPHALDDGVFAATRVMRTMEEARRRRTSLTTRLSGGDLEFDEWDVVLTGPENRPIRLGQERVRQAAARLREEVAKLRRILHSALADNRRYLEVLLGEGSSGAARTATYGRAADPEEVGAGAVLDRTV
jgi:hypothetical protein